MSLDMERNIPISYTSITLTREMKIKGSLLQEVKVLDKSYFIVSFSGADFICGDWHRKLQSNHPIASVKGAFPSSLGSHWQWTAETGSPLPFCGFSLAHSPPTVDLAWIFFLSFSQMRCSKVHLRGVPPGSSKYTELKKLSLSVSREWCKTMASQERTLSSANEKGCSFPSWYLWTHNACKVN